jgi:hypothetical protein
MSHSPSHSDSGGTFTVPECHVALVLLQEGDSSFYLQIPLDIIRSLCLKPRKYLLFLAWCILGNEGVLALEHDGGGIDTNGDLGDQGIYYYVPVKALGSFLSRCYCCHACKQYTYGMLSCPTKISPVLLTSRLSSVGQTRLQNRHRRVTNFAQNCWSVTFVVFGQDSTDMEMLSTSFPMSAVPLYVPNSPARNRGHLIAPLYSAISVVSVGRR